VSDAIVKMRPNPNAKRDFKQLQFQAVKEVFELDIKPEAVKNSPVTEEGLQRNIEKGKRRPGGTGTNRRSIDVEVKESPRGPEATLFTQSGYGGYLEVGTSKMRAQPYLYPAFKKYVNKIADLIRQRNK
jgi:HK97 gp10 family phage protein